MWAAEGDFETAKKAYKKGRYKIAEVYTVVKRYSIYF
jgi:hypothetical protein